MTAIAPRLADPWSGIELGPAIGVPAAIGGELTPQTLMAAYHRGLLCQPRSDPAEISRNEVAYGPDVRAGHIPVLPGAGNPYALLWWSPHDRYVIPAERIHIGRTLRRAIRDCSWTTTVDADFAGVMAGCRGHREPRWLTDELIAVHEALRSQGKTRTVEVWEGSRLIGGLFGRSLGKVFIMDSAFHVKPHASKVAIADLSRRAAAAGYALLDAQVRTEYTIQLGAVPISSREYLAQLRHADPGVIDTGARAAYSLLGQGGLSG